MMVETEVDWNSSTVLTDRKRFVAEKVEVDRCEMLLFLQWLCRQLKYLLIRQLNYLLMRQMNKLLLLLRHLNKLLLSKNKLL